MDLSLWTESMTLAWNQTLGAVIAYLPRGIFAILVALLGIVLGNYLRDLLIKALGMLKFEQAIKDTKFQAFLKKAEITHKLEDLVAGTVKWVVVITFFISATNLAGLTSVASILTGILSYVPSVISAVIVLALGVLLAGLVEGVVKGSLSSIDLKTARLMGKISSYTVVSIAILAAFSEMGIAANFINTLFIGFVAMLSLGFGLALGLGAKDVVNKMLTDWYKQVQKELKN